jgi:hypothetical protein
LALKGRDYIHASAVLPKGKSLGYSLEGDQVNATASLGTAGQGYWTDVACGAFRKVQYTIYTYIYIYIYIYMVRGIALLFHDHGTRMR